ncbi:MAG: acyl--CoA ligase [Burkholderiaceae bacterium]|nr:acyl--CoA ligase [Burkholderiaceae bacterium]
MFEVLRERMEENAERIAIVSDGREYSYRMLADAVRAEEARLAVANIGPGHVVALIGEFSFAALACMLALFFRKATVVPLTREAHAKLGKYVEQLGVDFLIDTYAPPDVAIQPAAAQETKAAQASSDWRSILPSDTGGLIVFTSGSTGVPKAIVHNIDSLCYRYLDKKEPLSSICFLLFDHMGGINTVLFLLFRGGTAVNVAERQVDIVCQAVQKYRCQLLPTTPSFLSQLLMSRAYASYDLSSLQVVSYGTEVMSEAVLKKMNEVLPGCVFKQTYGLSETGVLQIKSRSNDTLWFKFIDAGVQSKVEDHILWIKTQSNLLGKVLFTEQGLKLEENSHEWFCTNDLVETDGEYLMILGRQTDIINVGGLKVYPSEVENCIHELPFIDDVFVKAKKHPMLGQIVVAYILQNGTLEKAEAERLIKRHCLARMEKFKVPSQFIFNWENFVNDRFKKVRSA